MGRFSVLVRGIFLYHLKAYLYGFILSRGFKFLGAPFMVKNYLTFTWPQVNSISVLQMIEKKNPLTSTEKRPTFLVRAYNIQENNNIAIARPIFV